MRLSKLFGRLRSQRPPSEASAPHGGAQAARSAPPAEPARTAPPGARRSAPGSRSDAPASSGPGATATGSTSGARSAGAGSAVAGATSAASAGPAANGGGGGTATAVRQGEPLVSDRTDVMEAEELALQGRWEEAVDAMAAANRTQRDPAIEVRLVEMRCLAAAALEPGPGRADWPPVYADPFPDVVGRLPEVDAESLTTEILGGAVAHHGCLIVRGVFSPEQVARTTEAIERTHLDYRAEMEARIAAGEEVELLPYHPGVPIDADRATDDIWYRPLDVIDAKMPINALRKMVAKQGGTFLADSPTSTAQILDELHAAGVTGAIAGHLGERPYFSLQKSTLRRSLPINNLVAWHQDGSFLDADVRTMNVWVALSPCGGDRPSPGMELLPRRLDEVLPVDGVMSPHSISYDLVAELAAEMPTDIPLFDAGDAMIFDERFLHRTHLAEGMTDIRYALECWFFAPSHQATSYTPLLV